MTGLREWIETAREDRWGLLIDLVFAIVWVTAIDLLFQILDGPDWAYYMFMLAGIAAYFLFFANLELATSEK